MGLAHLEIMGQSLSLSYGNPAPHLLARVHKGALLQVATSTRFPI